jgi:beta-glucosidase
MNITVRRLNLLGAIACAASIVYLSPTVRAASDGETPVSATAGMPVEQRVETLLKQMTLEEKVDMISGVRQRYLRGNERMGLPDLRMSDGPNGVHDYGPNLSNPYPTTAYPVGIALAATWDTALAYRYGEGMGRDARARGVHFILGPGINIYRVPQCGRNFEYFGEDPFLTSKIVVGYVQGVQRHRVCPTVKHFACNNHENDRNHDSSEVDERTLEEIYFPAFKAAVQEGKAGAIMSSYNLLNGTYTSASDWLINQTLKKQWGFSGIMMSDWWAVHDARGAFNAGLDLEMPDDRYMNRKTLIPLLKDGTLSEAVLDDKIRRILRVSISMGWLDQRQQDKTISFDDPQNAATALDVARAGIVLLKNQNNLLPLDKNKVKTIVVLGQNADPAVTGGGGSGYSPAFREVSVLDGVLDKAGSTIKVIHIPPTQQISTEQLAKESRFDGPLKAEFFNNTALEGAPVLSREDARIDFNWTSNEPVQGLGTQKFSVRWTGKIAATVSGSHRFVIQSDDGFRLKINGQTVMENWSDHAAETQSKIINMDAGKSYDVVVEYYQGIGDAVMRFGWAPVANSMFSPATAAKIAKADAVVACVGFSNRSEAEGIDRSLTMPDNQDELVTAVAQINPRTVVVLNAGGNVDMSQWLGHVPALIHAWYPGEMGGTALAEILFGDVNPCGKLPVSFEKRWEDAAAFGNFPAANHKIKYAEGIFVGYRHFDAKNIEPQFPFGFGLSYTTFTYGPAKLSAKSMKAGETLTITVPVTNSGKRAGAEIVQLYVHDAHASVPRPPQELKGFQKLFLKPGETKTATFTITTDDLSFWDVTTHAWKAEPGDFELRVGSSSRDIRAKTTFELK